jgi:hypothetical protein
MREQTKRAQPGAAGLSTQGRAGYKRTVAFVDLP